MKSNSIRRSINTFLNRTHSSHPNPNPTSTNPSQSTSNHHQQQQQQLKWFNRSIPPYGYLRTHDPILFPPLSTLNPSHHPSIDPGPSRPHRPAFPPAPHPHPPPALSRSIASLHNAALVHLHRGLNLPTTHPDAFHSAVVRGFYQIVRLDTGLEYSLPREFLISLLNLVRRRLSDHSQPDDPHWPACCAVLVLVGTRPTITDLGQWAWEAVSRGEYSRLFEVWAGIREAPDRRRALAHDSPQFGPGAPSAFEDNTNPVALDGQFFTALVAVSAVLADGPPLTALIDSLVTTVWSYIHWPHQRPSPLEALPDPARAVYFIRSVELALMWRRPLPTSTSGSPAQEEDANLARELKIGPSDERIVRYLRRKFRDERDGGRRAAEELWGRVREAVEGPEKGSEAGWLKLDWKEPVLELNSTNLIEDENEGAKVEPQMPSMEFTQSILLTQRLVGVFLTAFSRLSMLERVEEVIDFVRRSCGGMSLYLWAAILRGLVWRQDYTLTKRFFERMRAEDGIEPDLNVSCLMISTSFGSTTPDAVDEGLAAVDALLLREAKSACPTEALNIIISALLRHKLLERAEELVRKLKTRLNATTLNHFLNFHSRHHQQPDLAGVLATLKSFEALDIAPDVVSFTILLNVLMKLGCGRSGANKLLEMMERIGVKANAITYGSIVHHLCRSGQVEELDVALGLVDEIEQRGV